MIDYVFIIFVNGWPMDVDRFKTIKECNEKVAIYMRAQKQSNAQYKVWCERREVKRTND